MSHCELVTAVPTALWRCQGCGQTWEGNDLWAAARGFRDHYFCPVPEHPMYAAAKACLPRQLLDGSRLERQDHRAPWPLKKEWLRVQRWWGLGRTHVEGSL